MKVLEFDPYEKGAVIQRVMLVVHGRPVPYVRMTQRSKYVSRQARRYLQYKEDVKKSALSARVLYPDAPGSQPERVCLSVKAFFPDMKHGDPENIRKGIQDALFSSDKHVVGAFDYDYDRENPRVEIVILWQVNEE